MSAEDHKKKQKFLRKEVLDKHYDDTLFVNFQESKKALGANVDSWAYDELVMVVKEFQDKNQARMSLGPRSANLSKNNSLQPQPQTKLQKDNSRQNVQDLDIKPLKEKMVDQESNLDNSELKITPTLNLTDIIQPSDYEYEKECYLAEENKLMTADNLKIEVGDPEMVKAKQLHSDYIVFTIKTSPFGWTVKRRYKDFIWLFDCMKSHFPFNYLPNMPSKTMGSKTNEFTIMKRLSNFKEFVSIISSDKDFLSCSELVQFLSLGEVPFQNYRNTFGEAKSTIIAPNKITSLNTRNYKNYDISHHKNATGIINMASTKKNHQYQGKVKKLIFDSYPIYDESILLVKELESLLQKVGATYSSLAECYERLSTSYLEAFESTKQTLLEKNHNLYNKSAQVFKELGKVYDCTSKDYFDTLNGMINYSKKEIESIQDLFRKWTQYTVGYKDRATALIKKKEDELSTKRDQKAYYPKDYKNVDDSKWPQEQRRLMAFKTMMPEESEIVDYLKDVSGHSENQLVTESTKYLSYHLNRMSNGWNGWVSLRNRRLTDEMKIWADFISNCMLIM